MRPVNLLPRDARPQAPRLALMVGAAVVAWLLVLAFATIATQGRVTDAENAADALRADVDRLTGEIAELSDVRATMLEYDAATEMLEMLLEGDVSWAELMSSLSREIPTRVWLDGFSGTATPDDSDGFGQVSMTGAAFDYPDISSWIRALDSAAFRGVSSPWVQSVSESTIGAADVVVFSSTTELTEEALSERLRFRVPEVR